MLILTPMNFSSLTWSERISADLGYSDILIFLKKMIAYSVVQTKLTKSQSCVHVGYCSEACL